MNTATLEVRHRAETRIQDTPTPPDRPVSIYEVHPGSWMRVPEEQNRPLGGAEFAAKLSGYMKWLNFTHVQVLLEPATRFAPDEFAILVKQLRREGLGVILDTVEKPAVEVDGRRTGDVTTLIGSDSNCVLKWDVSWSHAVLEFFAQDPIRRKFHQKLLPAHAHGAQAANFILPLSHDEVLPGRRSLLSKMPGDDWQKFANLRLLLGFMYAQPGKKLVFMGGEFGQWQAWDPAASLDWHLVQPGSRHERLQRWVGDLNALYLREPALHESPAADSFEWVDTADTEQSVLSWLRRSDDGEVILAVCNCTPVPRHNYRVGAPAGGCWQELANSDAREYGGSGQGNLGGVDASPFGWHDQSHSLVLTLPPLGIVLFKATGSDSHE